MKALVQHGRIYLMEAVCLGIFMISASFFGTLLEAAHSPVHLWISSSFIRLCLMVLLLGQAFRQAPVRYAVTAPGKDGVIWAFWVEVVIAFITMMVVLIFTNTQRLAKYTGIIVGTLVSCYVVVSGPISGFSMNPARTLASAVPSMMFTAFWIYLTAPFLGMFTAAMLYRFGHIRIKCAKLFHSDHYPCIFNCGYRIQQVPGLVSASNGKEKLHPSGHEEPSIRANP